MVEYEYLGVETEDRARWITLDNEEKLNALNTTLLAEFEDALLDAEADDEIRVIVLRGAGRAFSSGYDFSDEGSGTMDDRIKAPSASHLDTMWNLNLPIIGAVDGYALASGCNLALACDQTYATDRSEFGFPDVHMGALPFRFVVPFVTDSMKHARELLYTGKHISAREAEEIGLINRAVEDEDALREIIDEQIEYIKLTPSSVVKLIKDTLNDVQETQGYRSNSAANIEKYLSLISSETETAYRFDEIVEEEGVKAGIEWMNTADKD